MMNDYNDINNEQEYHTDLTISMKNGKIIGYAEYGDLNGLPVFFFHGMGFGSRLDGYFLHHAALRNNYRLISIDRPGIGLSSIDKNRTILSWVNDIQEFTELLNINKFSIVAHSGGALYAAACAYKIPQRLKGIAIVSGVAPYEISPDDLLNGQKLLNNLVDRVPIIATILMKIMSIISKRPRMLKHLMEQLPKVDLHAIQKLCEDDYLKFFREPFRQGVAGTSQELKLVSKACGFDITSIIAECPINIWHGGLDKQVPLVRAKLYSKLIPSANIHYLESEGHVSLLINKGEQILRSLNS